MRLFLVGMMGSGKTTVGKLVAERLGVPFRDLDDEVVKLAGKSIARIFAEDGEEKFRDLEHEALASLPEIEEQSGLPGEVVATGGGVVLRWDNHDLLQWDRSEVVWLEAKTTTLAARLSGNERPLLAGLTGDAKIARLSQIRDDRRARYAEVARYSVQTDEYEMAAEQVADLIVKNLRARVKVFIGSRMAERMGGIVGPIRRAAMIVDAGVPREFVDRVAGSLSVKECKKFAIEGGESAKTVARWEEILCLLDGLDRHSVVIAIGGGATTDVVGFAAATYMRGLSWIAVPTTLIGMVDAAIGGKTAINLAIGKNLAGAFHLPRVVIDPDVLVTLPSRELESGWGEIVKYALIDPKGPWQAVTQSMAAGFGVPDVYVINRCATFKMRIVAEDPLEFGQRKVLNFGHTIGHAIEAACGFGVIPHGVAVVMGMRGAVWLSREKGLLARDEAEEILDLLARFPAPPLPPEATDDALMTPLLRDKKFKDGKLLFVLLKKRGEPVVDVEVTRDEALAAIRFVRGDAAR